MAIYNHFGLRNDVLTHPDSNASYAVPVRQYRYLQSRLLTHMIVIIFNGIRECFAFQCMDHSKPPCGLLMLREVTPAHERLSLSGFLFLRTIFTIQGTHRVDGLTACKR